MLPNDEIICKDEVDISDLVSPDHIDRDGDTPEFEPEIVDAILQGITHTKEVLDFCSKHVPPNCFTKKSHQLLAKACYSHYQSYGEVPSKNAVMLAVKREAADHKDRLLWLADVNIAFDDDFWEPVEYVKAEALAIAKKVKIKKAINKFLQGDVDEFYKLADESRNLDDTHDWQVFSDDELEAIPNPPWTVADHVPAGGIVTVTADSNVGKTFFALDMAYSVATGRDYFGEYPTQQGPVCYVYAEGVGGAKQRSDAWKDYHGVEKAPMFFVPFALDFSEEHTGRLLIQRVKEKCGSNPVMVVIDTLSDNFGGGDTSSHQDMRKFLNTVNKMRQTFGCGVVITHHTGWNDKRERGAKSIRDAADIALFLELDKGTDTISVSFEKVRDAAKPQSYLVKRELHGGALVLLRMGTKHEVKQAVDQTEEQTEFDMVKDHIPVTLDVSAGVTLVNLIDLTGLKRSKLQRVLTHGEELKVWHKGKTGESATLPYRYHRLA